MDKNVDVSHMRTNRLCRFFSVCAQERLKNVARTCSWYTLLMKWFKHRLIGELMNMRRISDRWGEAIGQKGKTFRAPSISGDCSTVGAAICDGGSSLSCGFDQALVLTLPTRSEAQGLDSQYRIVVNERHG